MKYLLSYLLIIVSLVSFSQDEKGNDKTVTVTVSGQGATQDAAKQSALRNAIEQAFGTFISSNTEILNDELVKDEIVSVSNGNIQKFDILSEVQTPNGEWSNTVKAIVSVSKLTSFCESKGIKVEFKGGLFAINIKQQQLNEQNEIAAIDNMCQVLRDISDKSFDFEIQPSDPLQKGDKWEVPVTITVKPNSNFSNYNEYFSNTLNGISLSVEEVQNYTKLNKKVYSIVFVSTINDKEIHRVYYIRTNRAIRNIISSIYYIKNSILNFNISNGISKNKGCKLVKDESFSILNDLINKRFEPILENRCRNSICFKNSYTEPYNYINFLSNFNIQCYKINNNSWLQDYLNSNIEISKCDVAISFSQIQISKELISFKYSDVLDLNDVSKITEYKITKNNSSEKFISIYNFEKQLYIDISNIKNENYKNSLKSKLITLNKSKRTYNDFIQETNRFSQSIVMKNPNVGSKLYKKIHSLSQIIATNISENRFTQGYNSFSIIDKSYNDFIKYVSNIVKDDDYPYSLENFKNRALKIGDIRMPSDGYWLPSEVNYFKKQLTPYIDAQNKEKIQTLINKFINQ